MIILLVILRVIDQNNTQLFFQILEHFSLIAGHYDDLVNTRLTELADLALDQYLASDRYQRLRHLI